MKKVTIILALILFFYIKSFAQSQAGPDSITHQAMLSDFRYYVDLLEKTHVDPYTPMGGKVKFITRVAEFEQKIPFKKTSVLDFTLLLSEFSSQLNDNHTNFDIRNNAANQGNKKQMPFYCKPSDDGIFIDIIKEDFSNLCGAKIIEINHERISDLLKKIRTIKTCENISNARFNLSQAIIYCNQAKQLFPEMNDSLHFKLINTRLDTIIRTIPWIEMDNLNKMDWHMKPRAIQLDNSQDLFHYQFVDKEKEVMYFSLKEMFAQEVQQMIMKQNANQGSWPESVLDRYYPELVKKYGVEEGLKHMPYFTEAFRNMLTEMKSKHAKYLVLDLTQNRGGYSALAIPALYLMYGDNCFSPEYESKMIKRISQLYLDKFGTTIEEYNKAHNTKYRIGDYNLSDIQKNSKHVDLKEVCKGRRDEYFQSLKENNFGWDQYINDMNGKSLYTPEVIVLTSAATNSAAYHFLYSLYKMSDIVVIGVAPSQAGNTPMEGTPFSLPISKIEGSISNSYQLLFSENDERAKLFKPHFSLSWNDFRQKNFSMYAELEIAIDLIKSGEID